MSRLIEKTHLFFLFSIPIFLLFGIWSRDATIDINVHDTYFVIAYFHLTFLLSLFFGTMGLGYWVAQKMNVPLSNGMKWIHLMLTFGGMLTVFILSQLHRSDRMEYTFNQHLEASIALIVLLILLGQVILPVNIVYGLIKNHNMAD